MARKIFVSYKHGDANVAQFTGFSTARNYVEELIDLFEDDEIYKGEGNEDLSDFKDGTIEDHLKDKIYDSSITLVLISPNMKEAYKAESDQWIPWEISYSLKEISRNDRTSHTNAMLAVVLPDGNGSYEYFLVENSCDNCSSRLLKTNTLFQILRKNMFNIRSPSTKECPEHPRRLVYSGQCSYIQSVKWADFVRETEKFLKTAEEIRNNIEDYDITKVVND